MNSFLLPAFVFLPPGVLYIVKLSSLQFCRPIFFYCLTKLLYKVLHLECRQQGDWHEHKPSSRSIHFGEESAYTVTVQLLTCPVNIPDGMAVAPTPRHTSKIRWNRDDPDCLLPCSCWTLSEHICIKLSFFQLLSVMLLGFFCLCLAQQVEVVRVTMPGFYWQWMVAHWARYLSL